MSFLTGPTLYRIAQILALLLLPAIFGLLFHLHIEEKIPVRGLVESVETVKVSSPVADTIVHRVLKRVGDEVAADEIVLEFEDLAGDRLQAEQRELKLSELREALTRLRPLFEAGSVPAQDVSRLEYQLGTAEFEKKAFLARAERLTVRSPVAGRIITLPIERFEKAEIGKPLFSVATGTARSVDCAVPERFFTYLYPRQRVHVRSEVLNYLKFGVFQGRVAEIGCFGFQRDGQILHKVRIELDDQASRIPVGSAADCEILIDGVPLIELLFPRK